MVHCPPLPPRPAPTLNSAEALMPRAPTADSSAWPLGQVIGQANLGAESALACCLGAADAVYSSVGRRDLQVNNLVRAKATACDGHEGARAHVGWTKLDGRLALRHSGRIWSRRLAGFTHAGGGMRGWRAPPRPSALRGRHRACPARSARPSRGRPGRLMSFRLSA